MAMLLLMPSLFFPFWLTDCLSNPQSIYFLFHTVFSCCTCLLPFLGTVGPDHKRPTQLLRGMLLCLSNSFSPQYEESQGQRVVYPKWFLSWELFKSQAYPATCNASSGHSKARCGECLWGKTGQSNFTLCYFSCSKVNLTLSFISSACFVHTMQFHMEVCILFLTFNLSKCLCTHKQERSKSLHHCWEQQGESGALSGVAGLSQIITSLFPAQAIYSVTKYTLFFRYPTKTILRFFTSLTPALLLLLLLKFLLMRTENATSHTIGFFWEQWSHLKLNLPSE